ncbi:MAG: esterase family protein [Oscillospiraceae bacterium]|nr:esterase family protein [Oscillospiraceae bacterium]
MALIHLNFESEYLCNNTDVNIIMPDKPRVEKPKDFYDSNKKYQVLWLLHGTYGDYTDWIRKSSIELYAAERNIIVVMPSAMNSNYLDWKGFGLGYNMWEYLTEELMPLVYNWLPASSKKEDNFIAGLSMGGGGTIQYVVGHPERFAAAAILSSAPSNHRKDMSEGTVLARTQTAINNYGGNEGYLDSPANVWELLPKLIKSKKLPRLYFTIGKDDSIAYKRYVAFKAYAEQIGLDAVFEEYDKYDHEWRFWDLTIQKALDFFGIPNTYAGNAF